MKISAFVRTACVSKKEHCIKPFVYRYCFLRERIKTKLRIKILEKFFGRPDPRTSILEPRPSTLEPQTSTPNPSSSILFPRSFMLDPSSSILDPPSPIFEPRSTILYPSSSILVDRILNKTIHTIPSNRTQIHVSG